MEKISYEVIKSVIGAENDVSKFVWAGLEIEVKRFLTIGEMFDFTNTVFEACFRQDDASYRPEVKDFMIRSCILDAYTNIEIPDDLQTRYDMVYRYEIIPEVMKYVDQNQFNAVLMAIDSKINNRLNANVEKFEKKMAEADEMIGKAVDYISGIFDGIDNETIKQVALSISNMSIDPEVLAKSIIEAKNQDENPKDME